MAGLDVGDVDLLELYDCYTYTVLITLEDYGFCPKGEGGMFVADGHTGPGGSLPVNTGGGQLSSYYLWGMTPVTEAVIQARGQAGERQVRERDVIMVSGNGGVLDHHSTLVLSLPSGRRECDLTGVDLPAADLSGVHGPVIGRDEHTAPFFDAARRDELLIPRCALCGRWHGPQAVTCFNCGGDRLTWEHAAGAAELVAWAVVHSAPHRAFADQLPYVTGYAELAEGPWLLARIVGADPARLHAGFELRVAFAHPAEGESYPILVHTPAAETSDPIARGT